MLTANSLVSDSLVLIQVDEVTGTKFSFSLFHAIHFPTWHLQRPPLSVLPKGPDKPDLGRKCIIKMLPQTLVKKPCIVASPCNLNNEGVGTADPLASLTSNPTQVSKTQAK